GLGAGGTLTGSGGLTVNGAFNWTGGVLTGSGSTTVAGGGSLAITVPSLKALTQRTLNNGGAAVWSGGDMGAGNGGTVNNTGSFEIQHDGQWFSNFGGAPTTFNNPGLLRRSTSAGLAGLDHAVVNN